MKNSNNYLNEALRHITLAERISSQTYPLVEDNKLFLKILEELNKSIINIVNAAYKTTFFKKEISQEKIKKINKILSKMNLNKQDIDTIQEILRLNQYHKSSAVEFSRKNKIVIMNDNIETITLDIHKIREYLRIVKKLYIKLMSELDK